MSVLSFRLIPNPVQSLIALGALVAGLSLQQPVWAAPTEELAGGSTAVRLSPGFVNALGSLNVTPGTVGSGRLSEGIVSFPISGGAIDLGTVKTEIIHKGGLSLQAGNTRVELTDFIITTLGDKPVLTGLVTVNDSLLTRLPLFDLGLPPVTPPLQPVPGEKRSVTIPSVSVTLTAEAAAALNQVFGIQAFTPGFGIGTARVRTFVP